MQDLRHSLWQRISKIPNAGHRFAAGPGVSQQILQNEVTLAVEIQNIENRSRRPIAEGKSLLRPLRVGREHGGLGVDELLLIDAAVMDEIPTLHSVLRTVKPLQHQARDITAGGLSAAGDHLIHGAAVVPGSLTSVRADVVAAEQLALAP